MCIRDSSKYKEQKLLITNLREQKLSTLLLTPEILKMKRTLLFIPLIMFHFFVQGQKIESVEVDKFTGQKRVNTEYVNIAAGFTNVFKFKLRSVDSTCFLILMGTIAVGTVGINDPMIFLFEDKTTFKIYPTSVQSYNIGAVSYTHLTLPTSDLV